MPTPRKETPTPKVEEKDKDLANSGAGAAATTANTQNAGDQEKPADAVKSTSESPASSANVAEFTKTIEELTERAEKAEKERDAANSSLADANSLVEAQKKKLDLIDELASKKAGKNSPELELTETQVATVAETKAKQVKVKFLKDHSFSVGMLDIHATKDSTHSVDVNIANKLATRQIGVIVN